MDRALREYLSLAAIGLVMLIFVFGTIWYLGQFSVQEAKSDNQLDLELSPGQSLALDLTGVELEVVALESKEGAEMESKVIYEVTSTGRGESNAQALAASMPAWAPASNGVRIEWHADLDDLALARGTGQSRIGKLRVEIPPGVHVQANSALGCRFSGDFGSAGLSCQSTDGSAVMQGKARSLEFNTVIGEIAVLLSGYVGWIDTRSVSGETLLVGPVGELKAQSSSGAIRVKLETAPISVSLITQSGEIAASGLAGRVKAETDTGLMRLALGELESDDSLQVNTNSGDIELFPNPDNDIELSALSSVGMVWAPQAEAEIGKEFKIAPVTRPAARVVIRSESGRIRLLSQNTIDPLVVPSPAAAETPDTP